MVDDACQDDSLSIFEDVLSRHRVWPFTLRRISHPCNLGLPSARNSGLDVAQGEFIFHCDADDFLEPNALEVLYHTATATGTDIVWCDWWLSCPKGELYMSQPDERNPKDAIRAMLSGRMKFNVWNKLVSRRLYVRGGVRFPDGNSMGEDLTMILLFQYANVVTHISRALYHYVTVNYNALSFGYSDEKMRQVENNLNRVIRSLIGKYGEEFKEEIAIAKLEAKFPLLLQDSSVLRKSWSLYYPEANDYISSAAFSLHRKIPQIFANKGQWTFLCLYNCFFKFFHRIRYGQ